MSVPDDRRPGAPAPEENFLSRWARLKRESRERAPGELAEPAQRPDPEAQADAQQAAVQPEAPSHPPDSRDATSASDESPPVLPSLDSLTAESDFAAFMSAKVSPEMRRLALRKMFQNPKYAVVDALDPYRADYGAYTPLGDIITSDMKFHAERLLRRELEKAAEAAEAAGNAPPESAPAVAGTAPADPVSPADAAHGPDDAAAQDEAQHESTNPPEDGNERRDA